MENHSYKAGFSAGAASSKQDTIGLVIPRGVVTTNDPYFSRIITVLNDAFEQTKFKFKIFTMDQYNSEELVRLYMSNEASAFMIFGLKSIDELWLKLLHDHKIKFITIFAHFDEITSLACDNVKGGYIVGKYLIETGRKKIAFLHGSPQWIDSADRYTGLSMALSERGIGYNEGFTREGWFNYFIAEQEIADLLKTSKQAPDAIFAANDKMAMGAISAIVASGRKVPEDIAVIGYDNIGEAESYDPPITTIEQPIAAIARDAAEMIIEAVEGNKELSGKNTFYEPRLIIRKSA